MKKLCALFLIMLLALTGVMGVQAAGGATLSGDDSVTAGNTMELTVAVSDCPDVSSASVDVSFGDSFELMSAQWLKTGAITHYDTEKNKGVIGGLASPDINGDLFKLVLKAKTPSAEAQPVSVTVAAKNGAEDVIKATAQKSITVVCVSHTYDGWISVNDSNHQSICSACGEKGGLSPHQPGAAATETSAQLCTACGYQLAPALGVDAPGTAPSVDVQLPAANTAPAVDVRPPAPNADSFPWWIVIVLAVIFLIGIVLIVVKKKK